MSDKHILVFEFSCEAYNAFNKLKDEFELKSNSLLRHSLRLFDWYTSQIKKGNKIYFQEKDGKLKEVTFDFGE